MEMILQNDYGMFKKVKLGFSWTTVFFGFFVPLLRGDLKWAAIMFLVNVGAVMIAGPIGPVLWIVWGFFYNKLYIKDLCEKGYKSADMNNQLILMQYVA